MVSHKNNRVDKCDAASAGTLPGRGIGFRSDRMIVSTCRASACSIQRVGIAFRMIRPSQRPSCIKNVDEKGYWLPCPTRVNQITLG